jgi:hypothetical protein
MIRPTLTSAQMEGGMAEARADDTLAIKHALSEWLMDSSQPYWYDTPTRLPIAVLGRTSERGFKHAVTGRLLCPPDLDYDL